MSVKPTIRLRDDLKVTLITLCSTFTEFVDLFSLKTCESIIFKCCFVYVSLTSSPSPPLKLTTGRSNTFVTFMPEIEHIHTQQALRMSD